MVIFHSYVKLPEGNPNISQLFLQKLKECEPTKVAMSSNGFFYGLNGDSETKNMWVNSTNDNWGPMNKSKLRGNVTHLLAKVWRKPDLTPKFRVLSGYVCWFINPMN